MNADEIVRALRSNAEVNTHAAAMLMAADLIESMQAKLAESQRTGQAAVESLKRKCLDERAAVKCICDIETYLELGSAKYIKKAIDAWRGPMAEKGASHDWPNSGDSRQM